MYQPFTITDGSGGYSILNGTSTDPTPTHSGSLSAVSGDCWVRLLKTATVTESGANANMDNLPAGSGLDSGWAYVPAGATLEFGVERFNGATQSETEPVVQIDIYFVGTGTVTCLQH